MATDGTHATETTPPSRTCELDAYLSPTVDFLLLLAVALTFAVAGAAVFIP